jgi:hypothetical protein
MKCALFVLLLFSIPVLAQETGNAQAYGNASGETTATAQQPAVIPAILSRSVDSKKAKVGDEVTARVANEVRTANGLVIPRDAKLIGKITQANARSKGDGTSALGLSFDRATLKDGTTVNLISTIQAVIVAPQPTPPPADSMGDASAGAGGGYGTGRASGGPVSGVGSTVGGMATDVTNTAGSVAGNTVGALPQAAGSDSLITTRTTGVVGIKNVQISSTASTGTVLSSDDKSVKLDGGTRLLVNVSSASAAQPQSQPK